MKQKLMRSVFGSVLAIGFLSACAATPQSPVLNIEAAQMAPAAKPAPKGMVAAAEPRAVNAGLEALRKGGTAIDAAIAVQTMLSLTEPQSSGIGGGAFLIYYDAKSGKVTAYHGREKAPAAADENLLLGADGKPMGYMTKVTSGHSTGAPGAIAMLHMAHSDHGKLDWSEGFTAAEKLADKGFVISPRLAGLLKRYAPYALKNDVEAGPYFYHADGTPKAEGEVLKNPKYAEAMRQIGADYRNLYEGPIAQAFVDAVRRDPLPGKLTMEDMANYTPVKSEALCSPYRAYILCSAWPPSSGGVAVQSIMGQLENFDMKALGPSLEGWHIFAEASALAYADRDEFVGDPDYVDVPVREMLAPDYLAARAALIRTDGAIENVTAGDPAGFTPGKDATPDQKGTSHFSIADQYGNVVSMTTTIEAGFGSQRMAHGFLLNNQLTDFSAEPRDAKGVLIANRPGSSKRPRSSMAPHIVFGPDGQFEFATGSPGGSSIIAYTAKTIVAMIDWGMSPQEAASLANVISRNGAVRLEEGKLDEAIIRGLENLGHTVVRSKGEISGIHIIRKRLDGSYEGAADPRREGKAEGQ